jgi:glycosyltransferase involved in cell wall biosynthesis
VSQPQQIDVLLVSPSTTAGWRRSDAEVVSALEELGVSVARCSSDYRIVRHIRRTMLLADVGEAAAMRRSVTKALRRDRPRAIIYSTPQATMFQPRRRLEGSTAIRFDALTRKNRPGRLNALQHLLERRSLAAVAMLLPIGLEPGARTPEELLRQANVVALPLPIELRHEEEEGGSEAAAREPIVLCYAGSPRKKGLDVIVRAWALAELPGEIVLCVAGIDQAAGREFLRRRGVPEPEGFEWTGMLDPVAYRELVGRATVFLAASRYEEYGLAQLEALAAGALLVTVPSPGGYEALEIARKLDPRLVSEDSSPAALAASLRAALSLPEDERRRYRREARALLEPHSREELKRRLQRDVLPVLLP